MCGSLEAPSQMGMDIGAESYSPVIVVGWVQGVSDACEPEVHKIITTPGLGLSLSVDSGPSRLISVPKIGVSLQQHSRENRKSRVDQLINQAGWSVQTGH